MGWGEVEGREGMGMGILVFYFILRYSSRCQLVFFRFHGYFSVHALHACDFPRRLGPGRLTCVLFYCDGYVYVLGANVCECM